MIVHLIGSIRNGEEDKTYLQKIIEVIHECGGVLGHEWFDAALVRHKNRLVFQDWKPFVQSNLESLKRADVVIVDVTHYAFSHGFQAAAALEHNKPTLILHREKITDKAITGISNSLFSYKQYKDTEDLEIAVRKFIEKNKVHTQDLRFNMFLTRRMQQYLETAIDETGKSKSEIIRALIKRKIQNNKDKK